MLFCSLLAAAVWGAAWARVRPTLVGHAVEGGYAIESVFNAQFVGLIGALLGASVIALALGVVGYVRGEKQRGIGMQLWAGLCALSAMGTVVVFAHVLAPQVPAEMAETVRFAPAFDPGIGWLLAPMVAMFVYWSACFVSADQDWLLSSEESAAEETAAEELAAETSDA